MLFFEGEKTRVNYLFPVHYFHIITDVLDIVALKKYDDVTLGS